MTAAPMFPDEMTLDEMTLENYIGVQKLVARVTRH
jgi:hypothetical protein